MMTCHAHEPDACPEDRCHQSIWCGNDICADSHIFTGSDACAQGGGNQAFGSFMQTFGAVKVGPTSFFRQALKSDIASHNDTDIQWTPNMPHHDTDSIYCMLVVQAHEEQGERAAVPRGRPRGDRTLLGARFAGSSPHLRIFCHVQRHC